MSTADEQANAKDGGDAASRDVGDTIVVGTDFSEDAWRAALRAAQIARDGAFPRCRLVHVADAPWSSALAQRFGLGAAAQDAMLVEARRSMQQLADALYARCGIVFDAGVFVGPVVDTLVEQAANAALLVVGARGQHPVREFALGTSAERALRKRRGPVLVVRGAEPQQPYRRVLVAVDFSAQSQVALTKALLLAPEASLDVLHAYEVPFESKLRNAGLAEEQLLAYRQQAREDAVDALNRLLGESGAADAARQHVEPGYAPRIIVDTARERRSDLIAVGKHGTSALEELLLGSVTLHVLGESACDVLVV